jgi:cold shock protein
LRCEKVGLIVTVTRHKPKSDNRQFSHGVGIAKLKTLGERHMATGTVKWFNTQKGFGFIQPDEGGADVFVHISAVEKSGLRSLNEGQKVSYDVQNDPKKGKPAASNIKAA